MENIYFYLKENKIKYGAKKPDFNTRRFYNIAYSDWEYTLNDCKYDEYYLFYLIGYLTFNKIYNEKEYIDITDLIDYKCTWCLSDLSYINKKNKYGENFISCCPENNFKIMIKEK